MDSRNELIEWSPRVSQHKIRLLYENDANEIIDEDLIDDIAFSFLVRCQDIITVTAVCNQHGYYVENKTVSYHERNFDLRTLGYIGVFVIGGIIVVLGILLVKNQIKKHQ